MPAEIPGPVPGIRRRVATVTVKTARPAGTAGNVRGATGPREGPTVRLRPTSIDSTSGRLGEHPSWIVGLFRGDGIGHDGAGWKAFPTKSGGAKMIDRLR